MASPDADATAPTTGGGGGGGAGIDEDLYSRVQYALGSDAMQKMSCSSVLVVGVGGLGLEVAKNIVLTGMGRVGLYDDGLVTYCDLGSMFFADVADVGRPRVDVVIEQLRALNAGCPVEKHSTPPTLDAMRRYSVVVWCDRTRLEADAALHAALRGHGVRLVWAEARGCMGMLYVDVGDRHTVVDSTGMPEARCTVVNIEGAVVTVDDEEPAELGVGDVVVLAGVETTSGGVLPTREYRIARTKGLYAFELEGLSVSEGAYVRGGYVTQVKQKEVVAHLPLLEAYERAPVTGDLMSDPQELHTAFRALHRYSAAHAGALPELCSAAHAEEVKAACAAAGDGAADAAVTLALLAEASFNPVVCFMGGLAAQEVLKACTGKYRPTDQFFYYDGRHMVPKDHDFKPPPAKSRYASMIAVLGEATTKRVQDQKYFMVGCGALGCELLKNFALMGIGSGPKGFVTVTDPDKIERSNLSRQFLFRNEHIGGFKSKVASDAAKKINKKMKVMARTLRLDRDASATFDKRFWEKQGAVVTALDNVSARLYVDSMCVRHALKMFDSGTLGPQAHSQFVLPKVSETYGAKRDPVEKHIPQCTLHFFPNAIEHTIAFARDWFGGAFEAGAGVTQSFHDDAAKFEARLKTVPPKDRRGELEVLRDALRDFTLADCVRWARRAFHQLFDVSIQQVLEVHPLDKKDDQGKLFWRGKFKPPHKLDYDPTDATHRDFVYYAAKLKAELHGVAWDEAAAAVAVGAPLGADETADLYAVLGRTSDEVEEMDTRAGDEMLEEATKAAGAAAGGRKVLAPMEFEKDDPRNGHIPLLTAAANLRAMCYDIPTADAAEVKRISGRIIPAMITTTALITGLVCVELAKTEIRPALGIAAYRNAWVNLAAPMILSSEVEPATQHPYLSVESTTEHVPPEPAAFKAHPLYGKTWSVWDRLDVASQGDASLRQLFTACKEKFHLEATTEGVVLYSEFNPLHRSDMFEEVGMGTPVSKYVAMVTDEPAQKSLDLIVKAKACGVYLGKLPMLRYSWQE